MNKVEYSTCFDEVRLVEVEANGYKNWFDRFVVGLPKKREIEQQKDTDVKIVWNDEFIEYRAKRKDNVSEQSHLYILWKDVLAVLTTKNYVLIGADGPGFYIPKSAFDNGVNSFLAEIKAYNPNVEFRDV